MGDNRGAINTVYNPKYYNRIKHTLLKYQGIKKTVIKGNITVTYIPIGEILVNRLIKALTPAKYKQFLKLLNLSRPCKF